LSIALLLAGTLILLVVASTINTAQAQEDIVVRRGDTIAITVFLLQNGTYGNPVPNQMIEFFDQTHNLLLGTDATGSNGTASIDWAIPIDYFLGPAVVNATYRGNESIFLSPSTQWIVLHIVSSVQLIINYATGSLAPGDQFNFTVLLLDDTNTPIENASLIVLSESTVLATSRTNSSGVALFSLHCNNSWTALGENTIRVVHQEDIINFRASAEKSIIVDIQQIVTCIDINNHPDEITLGNSLDFKLNLTGNGSGISAEIGVFANGILVDSLTTDVLGSSSYSLIIDTRFSSGIHTFQLLYNGSERYVGSLTSFEIRIVSPVFIDIDSPVFPIIGNTMEFKVEIRDYYDRPFDETTIRFSDSSIMLNYTSQISYVPPSSSIWFSILGPPGPHILNIELVNPFITNSSYSISLLVWSRPNLILEKSSILHYASPQQELAFSFRMTDWSNNCSNRSCNVLINGLYNLSNTTDSNGIASFTLSAPNPEGMYNLSLVYDGNPVLYELTAKCEYLFMVSYSIPVHAELVEYEVVPPLQEVILSLRIRCLNGTSLSGINIRFTWLSQSNYMQSQIEGLLTLHLPVPQESGSYHLYYEVDGGRGLSPSSGSIEIAILSQDVLASQGVGIEGFVFSIILSFGAISLPILKQRSLGR
jgi:hypothetical protein